MLNKLGKFYKGKGKVCPRLLGANRGSIWLGSFPPDHIDSLSNPWAKLYYYLTQAQAQTGSSDYVTLINDAWVWGG